MGKRPADPENKTPAAPAAGAADGWARFRQALKSRVILADGAMGTLIYQRGVFIDKCYDELNLSNPELIRSIHDQYAEAGAELLETNTFGANRYKLQRHNLAQNLALINREGARIARESAGSLFVAGSMGPLGQERVTWGDQSEKEAREAFREQAAALIEGGVDCIILETFHDLNELLQAVRAVRSESAVPVIALMTAQEDGRTLYGVEVEEIARTLSGEAVEALGLNCAVGPKLMLDFLERMMPASSLPVAVMANAGKPQMVDGRTFYMSTSDYFGVYAKRFIEAGARIIGGCCGTTPDHIRKMAVAVTQKTTRSSATIPSVKSGPQAENLPEPVPVEKKSGISGKLTCGRFVRLVEMVSPRGKDISKHLEGARLLQEADIDGINIPDGPRASARLNGLALAVKLQEKIGIETVLHYTCRDRNLLGMQSDLLGASLLGIRNILAVTGDPPIMGDYPDATAVFDIDSVGLSRLLSRLNRGLDIGGKPIGEPTAFLIGVGVDPSSVNTGREIERLRLKCEAGAEFAVTQPVFDFATLEAFMDKAGPLPLHWIAGVWPLVSLRNAEFMKNEVPGVHVPDELIRRISRFEGKEDQLKAGIEIAVEMAGRVRKQTAGIQVSAPFGRYSLALEILCAG
ncbi:bifunctional homocysteine S-methyltransferase/methylenetetrahydrofolate reductase [bacterium]|nr:bifunctional homocysteine S-methyltransferase/methylenetetrahydrofolate reductase [bacterium]